MTFKGFKLVLNKKQSLFPAGADWFVHPLVVDPHLAGLAPAESRLSLSLLVCNTDSTGVVMWTAPWPKHDALIVKIPGDPLSCVKRAEI